MKIIKGGQIITSDALNAEYIASENIRKQNELQRIANEATRANVVEAIEVEYAPRLTGVESQLAEKADYYNSIADMKNSNRLKSGDYCKTLGYYSPNDGGIGTYIIKNDATLVDDGGSIHDLVNGLKAELVIENESVNAHQFGVKFDGTDCTPYIQRAINFALKTIVDSDYKKGICNVELLSEKYFLNSTVIQNDLVKVKSKGRVTLICNVPNGTAWKITPNDDLYDGTHILNVYDSYMSPWLDGSNGGIFIYSNTQVNSIGLEIGSNIKGEYPSMNRGSVSYVDIEFFHTNIKLSGVDLWLIRFDRITSTNSKIHIQVGGVGSGSAFNSNCGENMTFRDCMFGGGGIAYVDYSKMSIKFIGCSFDMIQAIFYSPKPALDLSVAVSYYLENCWIEQNGIAITNTVMPVIGIATVEDLDVNLYSVDNVITRVIISNSWIIESHPTLTAQHLFKGKQLSVSLDNVTIDSARGNMVTANSQAFMATDDVKWLYQKNLMLGTYSTGKFLSTKLNVNPNPNFEDVAVGQLMSLTPGTAIGSSYIISSSLSGGGTMRITDEASYIAGGKSLKLLPATGTASSIKLIQSKFTVIKPCDKIHVCLFMKGNFANFLDGILLFVHFYDINQNEILVEDRNRFSAYESPYPTNFAKLPISNDPYIAPPQAAYYKVEWYMRTNADHAVGSATYFSGLYVFNA